MLDDYKSLIKMAAEILRAEPQYLTIRPLLPQDVGKTDWLWNSKLIDIQNYRVVALYGLHIYDWQAIQIRKGSQFGTILSILTPDRLPDPLILKPLEQYWVNFTDQIQAYYKCPLSGYVIELKGVTIAY